MEKMGWAQKVGDKIWCHVNGETFSWSPQEDGRGYESESAGGGGELVAPMPGKIIKINKAEGDAVATGDAVIVMEAMKMEYSISSTITGTLNRLSCAEGDQVEMGQTLAIVEES